jgi:hypothetical protein
MFVESTPSTKESAVRRISIGGVIILIWLIIGAVAAVERGYFKGDDASCAKAGSIVLTVIAGPLNWAGLNPKISCDVDVPPPSK